MDDTEARVEELEAKLSALEDLENVVTDLDRTTTKLEERVAALEALLNTDPNPSPENGRAIQELICKDLAGHLPDYASSQIAYAVAAAVALATPGRPFQLRMELEREKQAAKSQGEQ